MLEDPDFPTVTVVTYAPSTLLYFWKVTAVVLQELVNTATAHKCRWLYPQRGPSIAFDFRI